MAWLDLCDGYNIGFHSASQTLNICITDITSCISPLTSCILGTLPFMIHLITSFQTLSSSCNFLNLFPSTISNFVLLLRLWIAGGYPANFCLTLPIPQGFLTVQMQRLSSFLPLRLLLGNLRFLPL